MSTNPNAIHILEQNINKIDWNKLHNNINSLDLFCKYPKNHNSRLCNLKEFKLDDKIITKKQANQYIQSSLLIQKNKLRNLFQVMCTKIKMNFWNEMKNEMWNENQKYNTFNNV